jgi:hypothetical protein
MKIERNCSNSPPLVVGQLVHFVFTTSGRGSVRHRSYAQGEVMKIGKRLTIKVVDDPNAHEYWRKAHVGKLKVVGHAAVIPELPEAAGHEKAAVKSRRHPASPHGTRDAADMQPSPYSLLRIAKELELTATGAAYYGNALRVTKDIPGVSDEERLLLDRYATGRQRDPDHVALQDLAIKLRTLG